MHPANSQLSKGHPFSKEDFLKFYPRIIIPPSQSAAVLAKEDALADKREDPREPERDLLVKCVPGAFSLHLQKEPCKSLWKGVFLIYHSTLLNRVWCLVKIF